MSRRQIIVPIAVFALLRLAVGAVLCKNQSADGSYHRPELPLEFFCAGGERIAPEMGRIFGLVPAESIVRVLENHGFSANAYHGAVDTLKQEKEVIQLWKTASPSKRAHHSNLAQ